MTILFILPDDLNEFTDGKSSISVEGKTFGDCMDALLKAYPDLKDEILDGDGRILLRWMIQINEDNVTAENERAIEIRDGDTIALVSLLA